MVQQNAESASELASSSEELSRQAALMRELTSRFHVSVNGPAPRPSGPSSGNGGVSRAEEREMRKLMQPEPVKSTPFAGR